MEYKKKINIFITTLLVTFILVRLYLWLFPRANIYLVGYNIHHLYLGAVLLIFTVIALIAGIQNKAIIILAGISSALILDQLVFLIATDGADATYLGKISLGGGIVAVLITTALAYAMYWWRKKK